ncbi:MAG: molybdate ABC transporter substrate-binding protein [Tepidisphaeraceae bacterium]
MLFFRTFAVTLLLAGSAHAETIRVAAAISLKESLASIAKGFKSDTGDDLEFTFGSSGQLQTQIQNGADVDVFISAANKQVDDLSKAKLVDDTTRRVVVMNSLVLIVPADAKEAPTGFADLTNANVAKVAVGEPKSVPAGQYAAQVFKKLNLDAALSERLVYGTNVRQVLTYVEQGEVSAGVVYATDAKASGEKVKVVATADPSWHEPIVYPAVVLSASKHGEVAKKLLDYLSSEKARAAFVAAGFVVPEAAGK